MRNGYLKMKDKTYNNDEKCFDTLLKPFPEQIEQKFESGEMELTCCPSFAWNYLKSLQYSRKKVLTKATYNMNACLAFIYMLLHFIILWQLKPFQLLNLDETGVFFAMAVMYAYAKGGKNQEAAPDKDEKKRLTVLLIIAMSGERFDATCIHKSLAKTISFFKKTFSNDADAMDFTKEFLPREKILSKIGKGAETAPQELSGVKRKSTGDSGKQKKKTKGTTTSNRRAHESDEEAEEEQDGNVGESGEERFVEDNDEDITDRYTLQFDDASDDIDSYSLDIFGNIKIKGDTLEVEKLLSSVVEFDNFCDQYNQNLREASVRVERGQGKRSAPGRFKEKHSHVDMKSEDFPIFLQTLHDLGEAEDKPILFELARYLETLQTTGDIRKTLNLSMIKYHAKNMCVGNGIVPEELFKDFGDHTDVIRKIDEMLSSDYIVDFLNTPFTETQEPSKSLYSTKQSNAWATAPTLLPAISETVLKSQKLKNEHYILTMDNFSSHHSHELKQEIKKTKGIALYMPAYGTSKYQPLDLRANATFKARLKKIYEERTLAFLNETRPKYLEKTERQELNILQAWNEVSPAAVRGGFTQMFENIQGFIAGLITTLSTPETKE